MLKILKQSSKPENGKKYSVNLIQIKHIRIQLIYITISTRTKTTLIIPDILKWGFLSAVGQLKVAIKSSCKEDSNRQG